MPITVNVGKNMNHLYYSAQYFHQLAKPMAITAGESEILTLREVADYLKVADRTIYRLASAKKIPAFKVGGTWRFSRLDIDAWIKQQSAVEQFGREDAKKAGK